MEELSKMGKPIEDIYACYQLIRKMPERYQLIIQYLLQLDDSDFKFKKLVNLLLAEETRLELRETELFGACVPVVQATNKVDRKRNFSSPSPPLKSGFKCFNCGQPGHYSRNCKNFSNSKNVKRNNPSNYPNKSKANFVKDRDTNPHAHFSESNSPIF